MGLCVSTPDDGAAKISSQIDRTIKNDKEKIEKELKILLLGSGESGKSTILKQMKILFNNGYSNREDLVIYAPIIFRNVLESVYEVANGFKTCGIVPELEENMLFVEKMSKLDLDSILSVEVTSELVKSMELLWNEKNIDKVLLNDKGVAVMDSADYFFQNARRISLPGYIPNIDDVLRARLKTTGITEIDFMMNNRIIRMFDVGGQRSERKKWIHCFEGVTSVIFCVSLSDYDQSLLEETSHNRMEESLNLFESIVSSRWFMRSSIILFLNKIDVFQKKIPILPLKNYFPEYKGSTIEDAITFIFWKYASKNRLGLPLYQHLTMATDTNNIRLIFAAVRETLLQNALKDSGIL